VVEVKAVMREADCPSWCSQREKSGTRRAVVKEEIRRAE